MRLLGGVSKNNVSLLLVQVQPLHHLRLPAIPGWQSAFRDQSWRRFPVTSKPVLPPDPGAAASSSIGKYLQPVSDDDTIIESSSIGKYLQPVSDDDTIIDILLDGIQNQLLETETAVSQQNSDTPSCAPSKIVPLDGKE